MLERGVTETIIGGAFIAILQDFVGLVDFLEAYLAGGVARISVRMPFHGQFTKGRLELGFVRVPIDLKGFVVTALGRHQSIPPERRFIPKDA